MRKVGRKVIKSHERSIKGIESGTQIWDLSWCTLLLSVLEPSGFPSFPPHSAEGTSTAARILARSYNVPVYLMAFLWWRLTVYLAASPDCRAATAATAASSASLMACTPGAAPLTEWRESEVPEPWHHGTCPDHEGGSRQERRNPSETSYDRYASLSPPTGDTPLLLGPEALALSGVDSDADLLQAVRSTLACIAQREGGPPADAADVPRHDQTVRNSLCSRTETLQKVLGTERSVHGAVVNIPFTGVPVLLSGKIRSRARKIRSD